ncbi:MAG: transketolase family protein [Lachnospiraceae bacterium]|nr:transketolase family protein [Lachnospiraceae bacterium]
MSLSTREAYGMALASLGSTEEFVVLDADLAKATQTLAFAQKFPHRFFDMGISEGDMIGTAAGIATTGEPVFASTFAMFAAGRAYEQIRNAVAYPRLNVKIAATHGGVLIGEDGASHQCIEDISLMRTIPGMTVLVPCDEHSTYLAVEAALKMDGPVYLRFGRCSSEPVYTKAAAKFEIGKGNVIRDGQDITIIAIGDLVFEALKAAEVLEKRNISTAVIDMASVKPIDSQLVRRYAEKTGKIITAEDHNVIGGLGGAVAEILAESGTAKLRRVGLQDEFGCSGKRAELQEKFKLNAEGILEAAAYFSC